MDNNEVAQVYLDHGHHDGHASSLIYPQAYGKEWIEEVLSSKPVERSLYLKWAYLNSQVLRVSLWALDVTHSMDIFAYYKTHDCDSAGHGSMSISLSKSARMTAHERNKRHIYTSPLVRLRDSYYDELTRKVQPIMRFMTCVNSLYSAFFILVQFIIHKWINPTLWQTGGDFKHKLDSLNPWLAATIQFSIHLGNPLMAATDYQILVHSYSLVQNWTMYFYLPRILRQIRTNALALRYWLDPLREVRRVDMVIVDKIENLVAQMLSFREAARQRRLAHTILRDHSDHNVRHHTELSFYRVDTLTRQLKTSRFDSRRFDHQFGCLKQLLKDPTSLRPHMYQAACYKRQIEVTAWSFNFVLIFMTNSFVPYIQAGYGFCAFARCLVYRRDLPRCRTIRPMDEYKQNDLVAFAMILMVSIVAGFTVRTIFQMVLYTCALILDGLKHLRGQILHCVASLRTYNELLAISSPKTVREQTEEIDSHLIKLLIRTLINLEDLVSMSTYTNQLSIVYLNTAFITVVMLGVSGVIRVIEDGGYREQLTILFIGMANVHLILCASTSFMITSFQKNLDTLYAAILYRTTQHDKRQSPNDFVGTTWNKIVCNSTLLSSRSLPCYFTIPLDFQFFLRFNVLALTVIGSIRNLSTSQLGTWEV